MPSSVRRLALIALALQCLPFRALGQTARRKKRIARLGLENDAFGGSIRTRLAELGFDAEAVEFRAFTLSNRGEDDITIARLAEVTAWQPDVVIVGNMTHLRVAKRAMSDTPIVFANLQDPDTLGIVASLARPGGNVTGAAVRYNDLFLKRMELARELSPKLQRVVVISDTRNGGIPAASQREIHAAAQRLGISVTELPVRGQNDDWCTWAPAVVEARADAILPWGNIGPSSAYSHRVSWGSQGYGECLHRLQRESRVPVIDDSVDTVPRGIVTALGEDQHESYRRATDIVVRILKGARPAEIPVDLSMRAQLFVNRRAAREIGLELPQTLLLRADRVVD